MTQGSARRRLHPATILIDFLRRAPQLVVLPSIFAFASQRGRLDLVLIVAGLGLAITGIIVWLRWRRFTYTLRDDALVIESGVLNRNRRTIPFGRIQDIDVERKLLERVFGVARVSVETGGAGSDEAALDSVSMAEAARLRAAFRASSRDESADEHEPVQTRPLFTMSPTRILIYGLFGFSMVWLAALVGGLNYLDELLPWDVFRPRQWIRNHPDFTKLLTLRLILVGIIVFGVLGVMAGVARTFVREYGFTLTEDEGRLRLVRGLITRSEAVVALDRVQLAVISAGWLRRFLGWEGLSLQTLGGSSDRGGRQEVAPFARPAEVDAVLLRTGLTRPDPATLRRVSSGHIVRSAIRKVGAPFVAIAVTGLFFPLVWLAFLLLPFPLVSALLARRFHRYGRADGTLAITRGVMAQHLWIVPERNIQAISIRRTWLQRRLGVATVAPDTAGARGEKPRISDVGVAEAWTIADALSR